MATTADILGFSRPPAIARRWSNHFHHLCAERDRLLARDCSTPEGSTTKLDELADAGAEETLQDMSLVNAAATRETLQEVLDALRRIERGSYGVCEITGEPIEPERLKAIPWARYSYAGQAELEEGGYRSRPRLPALGVLNETQPEEDEEDEKEKTVPGTLKN